MRSSSGLSSEDTDQSDESADTPETDAPETVSLDVLFPALVMLDDGGDPANPAIEQRTTDGRDDDTTPPTVAEIHTAFRQVFGEPAAQHRDTAKLHDTEVVSQDGTVSWIPDTAETAIGYETATYESVDDWYFDTAQYGGGLRGQDTIRDVYILTVDNGETWAAADGDRIAKMADFTGLTEPRLLDLAAIDTGDDNENTPIRFALTVGSLHLNPVNMSDEEVSVI